MHAVLARVASGETEYREQGVGHRLLILSVYIFSHNKDLKQIRGC